MASEEKMDNENKAKEPLTESPEREGLMREDHDAPDRQAAFRTLANFVLMATLFSANHGCTVSCLSLATSRLGAVGAWQSGTLYLTYTASAVLGATYITKELGGRNTIAAGMGLYCVYVGCFLVAAILPEMEKAVAITGAAIGGVGAGFLWTGQGAYFAKAASIHSHHLQQDVSVSTSYLAGLFASIYLMEEVVLRLLSSAVIKFVEWKTVFAIYTIIAIVSTLGMLVVQNYRSDGDNNESAERGIWYKCTAAVYLLFRDPKMKYMAGLNAAFGLASAFVNSYVNGEVVDSGAVGVVSAWTSLVAGTMSLVFSRIPSKGPVLIAGAVCFFLVAFPFIIRPGEFGWTLIGLVYTAQGVGRATFESTLKATFADYFPSEKEGAFANIILQNGLASAIGYVLSFILVCKEQSTYCVEFRNGSLHNVLSFEVLVCVTAVLAIAGYLRAASIFKTEHERPTTPGFDLIADDEAVEA